jgi:hypothetical protein
VLVNVKLTSFRTPYPPYLDGGSTAAYSAYGKELEKLRKREDFFIELPVVTGLRIERRHGV